LDVEGLRYEPRERLEALREGRELPARLDGLWCAGSLSGLERCCIAVVGTRAATAYGRRIARSVAAQLGAAGCCIVSGLALGIDALAHEGAIESGAPTIGVLGGGHNHFFPKRNVKLATQMIEMGGAVISPFPPDRPAYREQFCQRNGVVAALSDAIVVVEAPARSGALNTASWAAGRIPVFAVPGDVDRPHAAGCLSLIRDGATLARGAADVLEALHLPQLTLALRTPANESEDALQQRFLELLGEGELELDALIAATKSNAATASCALTMLELRGAIERTGPAQFARRR
jgi:DNA processing protein